MNKPKGMWRRVLVLAVAGGLGFWVANFAVSLTPIAAEYRAALSIPYLPMLLESLVGGLTIGFCVSWFLLRFFDRIPAGNPILKSLILSLAVLVVLTILLEVPGKFLTRMNHALRYFLAAAAFNAIRIMALGAVVGFLYRRLERTALTAIVIAASALGTFSCASPATDAASSATAALSIRTESVQSRDAKALIILAASPEGSTAKVASAIADELGATVMGPERGDLASSGDFELIGLGSGIFHGEHHAALFALADELPPARRQKVFLFSTCGIPARFASPDTLAEYVHKNHAALGAKLRAKGYEIVGEFGCPGFNDNNFLKLLGGLNRGRPNAADLESARAFATGLEQRMQSPPAENKDPPT